jgi:hypothetical protein
MIIQIKAAFEKFALIGLVSLLKAQINNTIKFTTGMDRMRKVTIQSPTEGMLSPTLVPVGVL